jgi:cytochrome d ubiquinol oxidase subunit I
MKVGLVIGLIASILQGIAGDASGRGVAKYQPMKLAAMEGIFQDTKGAPLTLFGVVNTKEERVDYAVGIPKLLSFLAYRDFDATVKGLNQEPRKDWPKVAYIFQFYRIMIVMWGIMLLLSIWGVFLWWRGTLYESKWTLRAMVASVIAPQLANQVGWISAEMGRYPWIVYNHLRISDGLSKAVVASQVFNSIIVFGVVYSFLFVMFIYLLNEKIKHGPDDEAVTPYHQLEDYVKEFAHD